MTSYLATDLLVERTIPPAQDKATSSLPLAAGSSPPQVPLPRPPLAHYYKITRPGSLSVILRHVFTLRFSSPSPILLGSATVLLVFYPSGGEKMIYCLLLSTTPLLLLESSRFGDTRVQKRAGAPFERSQPFFAPYHCKCDGGPVRR